MIHIISYSIRRILYSIPTIFIIFTIVFLVMRLVPGDPAMSVLGEHATEQSLQDMRSRMGLDQPLTQQYINFLEGIVRGNFGRSLSNNQLIGPRIFKVLPFTLELTIFGVIWGLIFGIPLGIFSAVKRNTIGDFLARIISLLGLSTPSFYLGVVLLIIFSVYLGWFPVIGSDIQANISSRLYFVFLPSLSVGLRIAAFIARSTRSNMIDILSEDYIRTAHSKGLSNKVVLLKHVMRNALISIVTITGIYFGVLLGGSILTEMIFTRPGLGSLLVNAISARDYPVIEAGLVFYSFLIILVNLIVDLTYGLIDPRITYK